MSLELRTTGNATTLGGDRELVFSSATQLAARIRTRRVSAVEVLETYLAQIERHNPTLNAIVTLDVEGARRRAAEADRAMMQGEVWGPLHGVPITIKDTLETAGLRTTAGYPPLADHVPTADATVVARLRQAGAILLGKTNVPPLALNFQTENPIFGRTLNPWNTDHTPGGSSGGSAAALAAGMTALDVGSDLRGSLRVPAHYSGVYTLKPTEHRIPTSGHIPELPGTPRGVRHMDTVGPLARTVEDLALALRVMAGPDERQWEIPPLPAQVPPRLKPARLRLAWTDDFAGVPVAGEIRAALAGLVQKLEGLGAQVERRLPHGFDFMAAWETWGELFQAEFGSTMSPQEEAEDAESGGVRPDAPSPEERGMA
ncbi:MAG TPA: amidase, partial [Chloroflexota bacterium]|nr:amidase [Chloroflexota bacterium]